MRPAPKQQRQDDSQTHTREYNARPAAPPRARAARAAPAARRVPRRAAAARARRRGDQPAVRAPIVPRATRRNKKLWNFQAAHKARVNGAARRAERGRAACARLRARVTVSGAAAGAGAAARRGRRRLRRVLGAPSRHEPCGKGRHWGGETFGVGFRRECKASI
jgi:hypothetical protein